MLTEHVRYLSETIGPRPSASQAEREAAEYIRAKFDSFGYNTDIDTFPALKTYSWLHFLHNMLFITAWALYFVSPPAAVVLCAAGLVSFALDVSSFAGLSILFPKSESCNTVAYKVPARPAVRKVIVSAHIDSSRSALFFHPKLVKNFRGTFVTNLAAMLATFAGAILFAAGFRSHWIWIITGILNIQLAVAALMLLDREIRGRHTPGAVDNASGVAAMLGAASMLAGKKLRRTEIEFVATGSEESGLFGMIHHMEKNWHDKTRTYVLNIDHVGIGDITATTREGMLLRRDSDPRLIELAASASGGETGISAKQRDFNTMLTDGYAAMMRDFKAISIMAFAPDGTLPNWHWHTDTADEINGDNLETAARLVADMILAIEQESEDVVKSVHEENNTGGQK